MIDRVTEIIRYKNMLANLVKRDLRGRYKGSFFGFLWNFINPLCQIVVYIIIFSMVFNNKLDKFYLYIIIGMMPWIFFSDSMVQGAGCVLHQADMAKKIYFPREILPLATVTSRFVNMCLTFVIMFAVIAISKNGISIFPLMLLPVIMIIEYIFVLGGVLLLSSISVYFRDVEHITGVLMLVWIWVTPIMYDINSFDNILLRKVLMCNPMTRIINVYHSILYYKVFPDKMDMIISAACSIVLLIIGEIVFYNLDGGFAEEL